MNPMETDDIVLRKAKFEDWESMHKNVWSRPETAKYMQWQITKTSGFCLTFLFEDGRRTGSFACSLSVAS